MKKLLCILMCLTIGLTMFGTGFVWADEEEIIEEEIIEEEYVEEETDGSNITDNDIFGGSEEEDTSGIVIADSTEVKALFTDIDGDLAKYAQLFVRTGLIEESEEGLFNPKDALTREFLVHTVMRILNLDEGFITTGDGYNDIPVTDPRYSDFKFAEELGLIKLYNDKTVRPDEKIKLGEVAEIFVKLTGYGVQVTNKNYLAVASNLGLLKNIRISANTVVTRAEFLDILFRAMNVNMLVKKQYAGDIAQYEVGNGVTLFSKYFDIYRIKGRVTSTPYATISDLGETRAGFIRIDDVLYQDSAKEYNELFGYDVECFYKKSVEDEIPTIVMLSKASNCTELTIMAEDIASYKNGVYTYYKNNSKKTVKVSSSHTFIYNGVQKWEYSEADFVPQAGYIRLISNDGENYDIVLVNNYANFVVSSVTAYGDIMAILLQYDQPAINLDFSNNLVVDMYNETGKMDVKIGIETYYDGDGILQTRRNFPKIPTNSLISVYADKFDYVRGMYVPSASARYMKIVINSTAVEGKVDSIADDNIVINGKDYYTSAINYLDKTEVKFGVGVVGKFLLDPNGMIAAWLPSGNSDGLKYGYLINAAMTSQLEGRLQFKMLTLDNEILVINLAKNIKVNGSVEKDHNELLERLRASAAMLQEGYTISQPIKYSLDSNGAINEINIVTASTDTSNEYLSRWDARTKFGARKEYGYVMYKAGETVVSRNPLDGTTKTTTLRQATYTAPTLMIRVPATETMNEEEYEVIYSWPRQTETIDVTADVFDVDKNLSPGLVVVYEAKKNGLLDVPFFVFENKGTSFGDDGETEMAFATGWTGLGQATYYADDLRAFDGVQRGDVYAMVSDDNKIIKDFTKCKYLFNVMDILNKDYDSETEDDTIYVRDNKGSAMVFTTWEAYQVNGSNIVMQRGTDIDGAKRTKQKITYWLPKASFHYGALYCIVEDGKMFFSAGAASNIKTAAAYGHTASSKILAAEHQGYGVRFMIIVNQI